MCEQRELRLELNGATQMVFASTPLISFLELILYWCL
jgi:hypothetical protein